MVACSSMETRQWQPTAVTDFKSVAGKWEGLLTTNDPRTLHYDRATVVIDNTGACESAITRTKTRVEGTSVSYDVIDVFAEQGKLVLTDDKLSTKFEKGGQMTVSFMWIQQVVSVCLKLRVKIVTGSPIPPNSNALETPPPQNNDPLPGSA